MFCVCSCSLLCFFLSRTVKKSCVSDVAVFLFFFFFSVGRLDSPPPIDFAVDRRLAVVCCVALLCCLGVHKREGGGCCAVSDFLSARSFSLLFRVWRLWLLALAFAVSVCLWPHGLLGLRASGASELCVCLFVCAFVCL